MRKLKDKFLQLVENTSANVALMTGILALPLFGAVAYAVDYTIMHNQKSAL